MRLLIFVVFGLQINASCASTLTATSGPYDSMHCQANTIGKNLSPSLPTSESASANAGFRSPKGFKILKSPSASGLVNICAELDASHLDGMDADESSGSRDPLLVDTATTHSEPKQEPIREVENRGFVPAGCLPQGAVINPILKLAEAAGRWARGVPAIFDVDGSGR
eukprot:CAMPEP_0113688996 /NCGR_PEP_ID=MMETSP0038_2-20120614/16880_1 /TAXON_ID=2898 /ORGANISM="Cryptomonas paramecium" /LENGTH=166 /DNA_ID=CAMNT_0000609941 /DNA_START=217 /DNA_END=713 /DNA_ORIENTATION=- /assembly_acc=CAM_ASM_000170